MSTDTETEAVEMYARQQAKIDGLRQILDILEANPALANRVWISSHVSAFVYDKDEFDRLRRLIGPHEKTIDSYSAIARRRINDEISLDVEVSRGEVCTKVKTGERLVEKEVLPEGVEMLTVVETEDVYEWQCPPSWGGS